MELAGRITADVIARGTIDQFMAGTDMGVLYGYVAPAPQPRAAPSSSSSSTSSGSSTPTSPSMETVSGWGDIKLNYVVGQTVSVTLPSSSHADVEGYMLAESEQLIPFGLAFDASTRQITGTAAVVTTTEEGFSSKLYSALDGAEDPMPIGEPFVLMLTINVRDADVQPDFRNRTIASMTFVEDTVLPTDPAPMLPAVVIGSGNEPITYSVSPLPADIMFDDETRVLSGTPMTPGSHRITYTAEDQDGDTASLTFMITVEANTDPAAPSIGNRTFTEGQVIAWTLPEGSGGNGALTYQLEGEEVAGLGLAFLERTRYLSGTVSDLEGDANSAIFVLTYTVTDTVGEDTDSTMFTITVNAAE